LLGQEELPPRKNVLVYRGVEVLSSKCQNPYSVQGIHSHEKACGGSKRKAVPQGRVKITGPLYPEAVARLAAEAEEGHRSTENAKRFKAWAKDTPDSAYDPDESEEDK
jgi:hypothetical protein